MEPDFSGYVTKSGIKCSDGRTITPDAFQHQDGTIVPLVWQHMHDAIDNVLGHVILSHRSDGIWGDGYFNDSKNGQAAKLAVQHKDIKFMSIFANQLREKAKSVMHGMIREVSLVLAGANPGAMIENVALAHGDGTEVLEDEALIYSGDEIVLAHAASTMAKKVPLKPAIPVAPTSSDDNSTDDDPTIQDVLNSMTPEQQNVTYALVGAALDEAKSGEGSAQHSQEDDTQVGNVFDQTKNKKDEGPTLSHADRVSIFDEAKKSGSLKQAVEAYTISHGIDSIETLFPYDKAVTDVPDWVSRRVEWVQGVLDTTKKTPFARIRSWTADLTQDEARAKGYIKGNLKKEEFIRISRRVTTPQTVYKKQKLDRDDITDITDFDVVAWLQVEMRIMLDEELARAILIGDGREADDLDKISEDHVRPILTDDEMYVTTINVDVAGAASADFIVDEVTMGFQYYRGTGTPTMYTSQSWLSKMLLAKDGMNRRLYATKEELSSALGVSTIIPCEVFDTIPSLIGIIVNLTDYTVGTDKGGQVSMFDFFDIDYNQMKYLIETRMSGAMTKYKGALVVMDVSGDTMLTEPTVPTFNKTTGVGTIPTMAHATYVTVAEDGTESSALTAGAQTAIAAGTTVTYRAVPAAGYAFPDNAHDEWDFTRNSS